MKTRNYEDDISWHYKLFTWTISIAFLGWLTYPEWSVFFNVMGK